MIEKKVCILFAGNMGAGKDTAANMFAEICHQRDLTTLRLAFADPIKVIAENLLGIPQSVSYGSQQDKENHKVYDKSARYWLQWIGTEMGRDQIHKDIWVHRFIERVRNSDKDVAIGSDCRFENEIAVTRQSLENVARVVVAKIINPRVVADTRHRSESWIFGAPDSLFDFVVQNDGTLEDLHNTLLLVANQLFH